VFILPVGASADVLTLIFPWYDQEQERKKKEGRPAMLRKPIKPLKIST